MEISILKETIKSFYKGHLNQQQSIEYDLEFDQILELVHQKDPQISFFGSCLLRKKIADKSISLTEYSWIEVFKVNVTDDLILRKLISTVYVFKSYFSMFFGAWKKIYMNIYLALSMDLQTQDKHVYTTFQ